MVESECIKRIKGHRKTWWWWHRPLVSVLGRQRQLEFCEFGASLVREWILGQLRLQLRKRM